MRMPNNWLESRPYLRVALLSFYYFAVLIALFVLYGRGDFSTPSFVYQGF